MQTAPHRDSCLWNVTALRRKRRALASCRGRSGNQNGAGTLESNLEAWGQGSNALKTLSTRNLTHQSTEELNIPVFSVMWRIKKLTSHGPFLKKTMLKGGLCDNEEVNRGKGRRKSMRRSNIGKRISRAKSEGSPGMAAVPQAKGQGPAGPLREGLCQQDEFIEDPLHLNICRGELVRWELGGLN